MTQDVRQPFGPEYGFALYVHWPYCAKICPYCDFNVYAAKGRDASVLTDALVADLLAHKTGLDEHPPFDSISFGGGTPSLMPPGNMRRIIEASRELFGLKTDVEISLEVNPNDVTAQSAAAWREIGINRLSVGVQSLRDDALQFLGRDHDAAGAMRAIKTALSYFPSVSIDLIYARPGQSGVMWEEELREAFALNVHHLSLYELTIEPETAFGKAAARGHMIPMGEEGQALLYELTEELTREAGYDAYEVSNHARGPLHYSRHNRIYWASGDWIGIGPGAHGRLSLEGGRLATEAEKRPSAYIERVESGFAESGVMWEEELREAFALNVHHLSLYELTIEPETAFGKAAARGHMIPMGEEGQALLYELTEELTREAGYDAYEVSNHARGPLHYSRHNRIYWASGDWIGIGPGAHGRLSLEGGRLATEAEKRPSAYIERVESGATGWSSSEALSAQDVARELISMGLRDVEGVEFARLEALTGEQVSAEKLDAFTQEGWIVCANGRMALTPSGRLLADALAAELAP